MKLFASPKRLKATLTTTFTTASVAVIRAGLELSARLSPARGGKYAFDVFCLPRVLPVKPKESAVLAQAQRWELPFDGGLLVGYTWQHDGQTQNGNAGNGNGNAGHSKDGHSKDGHRKAQHNKAQHSKARHSKMNEGDAEPMVQVPTVLLVHGWEFHAGRMTPLVQPLLQQGFRVVAFNAPAHGGSSGKGLNAVAYARAAHAVIERVAGGRVEGVVAHSLGGLAVSYMLARLGPESQTGSGSESSMQEPNKSVVVERLILLAPGGRLVDFIEVFRSVLRLSERVIRALRHEIERRFAPRTVEDFELHRLLPDVSAPTLLLHDKDDIVCSSAYSRIAASHAPSVTFVETTGLGHTSLLQAQFVTEAVVEFLTSPTSVYASARLPVDTRLDTSIYEAVE
jgi:pimeloyl-ACP methyl ester carboxylesterase